MIEHISWGFTIPAFIILCLVALVIWIVQDRADVVRVIDADIKYVARDLQAATDAEDVAYYEGIIEGLEHTKRVILKGKAK